MNQLIELLKEEKTGEKRKIKCYSCKETTAIIHQVLRTYFNRKKNKIKKVLCWKTKKGWKQVTSELWLCPKCDMNRCKRCEIVLSNKRVCHHCGKKHGEYYLNHPEFCKECWKIIKEQK